MVVTACGPIVYPRGESLPPVAEKGFQVPVTIIVEPPDGPAIPLAKLIADSVAQELAGNGVVAISGAAAKSVPPAPNLKGKQYVLKGRAEPNLSDREIPFVTVIHWTLFDEKGEDIGNYSQGVEGNRLQWEYGDPVIIRAVGKGAATPILSMIREDADVIPAAAPIRTALLIMPVLGAPSNGNQMLTRAIDAAVKAAGYATTDDPAQAGYILQGLVDVAVPESGRQKVLIVWKVTTGDGRDVGQASQENTLPQESLSGPWDRVAVTVVAAVFGSIDQMLEGARKYRVEQTPSGLPADGTVQPAPSSVPIPPVEPQNQPPQIAPLPQEPGRALPPPS